MRFTVRCIEGGAWSPWAHWRRWMLVLMVGGLASCAHEPRPRPAAPSPGAAAAPEVVAGDGPVRDWATYRLRAALRIAAASAGQTYDGVPPEPLLAIPVFEISLDARGNVTHVDLLRAPRQAKDTIELARAAILRAGPLGSPAGLPGPRKFVETFLFADDRRFKLRTLHERGLSPSQTQ
ncbi:MAG: hypothetical protein LCH73_07930 [Proteobacteria bacterium]|nr:hypothetical protein [Pseudomonadota bacterium]